MTMIGTARRSIVVAILGCALVVGGVVSAASAAAPAAGKSKTTTFIGEVPGTGAFIGIVVGKDSARAYLCDSEELGEWLEGAVSGGTIALESEGGATLVAEVKGKTLRGTLVLADNQVVALTAKRAKGKAGLFRKELTIDGQKVLAGWVRLEDGSVRGLLNALFPVEVAPTLPPFGPGNPSGGTTASTFPTLAPPPKEPNPPVPPEIVSQVPENPPANAVVKEAPALDTTVASTRALPPSPTPPAGFDEPACSLINRGLASILDELDVLDSDDLRSLVFSGTFGRLRDRAIFGGCQGVLEL